MTPSLQRGAQAVAEVLYPQWSWDELGPKLQNTCLKIAKAVWLSALPVPFSIGEAVLYDESVDDNEDDLVKDICNVVTAAVRHMAEEG